MGHAPSENGLESGWSCQFNPPNRAALVDWTLEFNEGRSIARENPHMCVGRLFAEEWRHQSSHATNFYLHNVAHGFVLGVATRYRLLAFWKDLKFYHSRLWSRRHHGNRGLWHIWVYVLHQREQQSIRDVGRQIAPLVQNLIFAGRILVSHRDLS